MNGKKLWALLLSFALCFSLFALPASAVETENNQAYAAQLLFDLGLMKGVGTKGDGSPDFDLGSAPNREQAVTMLVRLLGKDAAATAGNWTIPFTDVSDWARPYVGYAYANKLTFGVSATEFGGLAPVSATQYLTFVLRALGFSSETDFKWDEAWVLSDALSITFGEYDKYTQNFTRGDVAVISATALGAPMKDSPNTLLAYLNKNGALSKTRLVVMGLDVVTCHQDKLGFAFFPLDGSPNTYLNFKVNSVTVNGQTCQITQSTTQKEALAALPNLKTQYPEAFNYTLLTYDEAKAKNAATDSYDAGGGFGLPLLLFSFNCTGTLKDGTKVNEVFTEAVYIQSYDH